MLRLPTENTSDKEKKMEHWNEAKIKDFAEVKGGKRLPKGKQLIKEPNSHPYIRIRDLGKTKYLQLNSEYEYVDDETQQSIARYIVNKGDILISVVGTIGLIGIVGETLDKANQTENCDKIINIKNVLPEYLYYYLISSFGQDEIRKGTVGAVQPKLPLKNIQDITIFYPSIEEQERIVNILSSVDEKIEMNNAINNNLEQQIEMVLLKTINDTDTQPVKLGDYLYIKGRIGWKGLKKSEYLPISNYRIINGESLTLSGIDWKKAGYISAERYEESPEIMLSIGDILLSKDGTIGKIGYVDKLDAPTSVASGIFVIRNTRQSEISTQFIYYLLKSKLFKTFIASRTEGSVIPHLYQKDFMEFEFQLPSPDDMKIFDDTTADMFSLVFSNLNENERLIHLRNSLLPKLMSGELDVSDIDI
jgi:restriction endonuclease S subunit